MASSASVSSRKAMIGPIWTAPGPVSGGVDQLK
jgi:hypothetical protein